MSAVAYPGGASPAPTRPSVSRLRLAWEALARSLPEVGAGLARPAAWAAAAGTFTKGERTRWS